MITRVYIDNFRCFSNFEFRARRINLLFGLNGSGKSSFFDAVDRIIGLIVDGRDVSTLFAETDLTRWDSRQEQRFELDLKIDDATFTYCVTLETKSAGTGMVLRDERVTRDGRILFRYEDGDVHLYRKDGTEGSKFPF